MIKHYQLKKYEKHDITELFITAVPQRSTAKLQAHEVYTQIAKDLKAHRVNIFQERVFAAKDAVDSIKELRKDLLGDLTDNVPPSYLICEQGQTGALCGVQIHAVKSNEPAEIIKTDNNIPCGRLFTTPNCLYLGISALSALDAGSPAKQAYSMFNQANTILQSFSSDFLSVPRTWIWLGNILKWYDQFNQARNQFFKENRILNTSEHQPMPASTGIGLAPDNGAACAMDLTAVLKPKGQIKYLQAGGRQKSAFDYGSAFSRASRAPAPIGSNVFISGTASIDASGKTTNINNALGQIKDTIINVKAVLENMSCSEKDIVQTMVYCKTKEVEALFRNLAEKPDWPWIPIICDICRDNLLFEIEALAHTTRNS